MNQNSYAKMGRSIARTTELSQPSKAQSVVESYAYSFKIAIAIGAAFKLLPSDADLTPGSQRRIRFQHSSTVTGLTGKYRYIELFHICVFASDTAALPKPLTRTSLAHQIEHPIMTIHKPAKHIHGYRIAACLHQAQNANSDEGNLSTISVTIRLVANISLHRSLFRREFIESQYCILNFSIMQYSVLRQRFDSFDLVCEQGDMDSYPLESSSLFIPLEGVSRRQKSI